MGGERLMDIISWKKFKYKIAQLYLSGFAF